MAEKDVEEAYHNFMLSLADEVMELSDEELLATAEPIPEGVSVKEILLEVARQHPDWKLYELKKAREAELAKLAAARERIPQTAEARCSLFERILALGQDFGALMPAVQYREYRSLPDEDVTSCLEKLIALGALDLLERGPTTSSDDPSDGSAGA